MTIINDIEIDNIEYKPNEIREAIINNDPIESKLHVIIVVSNPCLYARRYILAREFIKRMEMDEHDVILYVVEFAYGDQKFIVTDSKCTRHLQIRTKIPIWHKENMINVGVKRLLPSNWRAFAWIDADVEFESPNWATDALKLLNGSKDIIQLFSHAIDMDKNKNTMSVFSSFGYQYCKGKQYGGKGLEHWHPGYAWACTRKAYNKMGGLFESAILGAGDNIIALCLIRNGLKAINEKSSDGYKKMVLDFENKIKNLRLGYIPGVIRHHYHGSKKNRKYSERWQILLKYNFDPLTCIKSNEIGLIIPTKICDKNMLIEISNYFKERNEDGK